METITWLLQNFMIEALIQLTLHYINGKEEDLKNTRTFQHMEEWLVIQLWSLTTHILSSPTNVALRETMTRNLPYISGQEVTF